MTVAASPVRAVWTEFRARFAMAGVLLVAAGVLVGNEEGLTRLVLLLVVVLSVASALALDGYVGVVVGLAGAVVVIVSRRLVGAFSAKYFFVICVEIITVITLPWVVGLLGHHLRQSLAHMSRPALGTLTSVRNSAGMLAAPAGTVRLDEEIERVGRTGELLALLVIAHQPLAGVDAAAREGAARAIVRHMESVLRDSDVPFAVDDETVAVILPATDAVDALEVTGRVTLAAAEATVTDPVTRATFRVADNVEVRTTLVFADHRTVDGQALLRAGCLALGDTDGSAGGVA